MAKRTPNQFKEEWIPPMWRRLVAWIIDAAIVAGLEMIVHGQAFQLMQERGVIDAPVEYAATHVAITLGLGVWMTYYTLLEWSPLRGTIGKVILGLEVVSFYGMKLSLFRAWDRWFMRALIYWLWGSLLVPLVTELVSLADQVAGQFIAASGWLEGLHDSHPAIALALGAAARLMVNASASAFAWTNRLRQAPYDKLVGCVVIRRGVIQRPPGFGLTPFSVQLAR